MKMKKKLLCLLLIMSTFVLLTACGKKADEVILETNNYLNEATSIDTDVKLDMAISTYQTEDSMSTMGITYNGKIEGNKQTIHLDGDMSLSMFGYSQSQKMDYYINKEENGNMTYAKNLSDVWVKTNVGEGNIDIFSILNFTENLNVDVLNKISKVSKKDGNYVVDIDLKKLTVEDAKVLFKDEQNTIDLQKTIETYNLKNFENCMLTLIVDKKTYEPKMVIVAINGIYTETLADNSSYNTKIDINGEIVINSFNTKNDFAVPQEVLEKAIEQEINQDVIDQVTTPETEQ